MPEQSFPNRLHQRPALAVVESDDAFFATGGNQATIICRRDGMQEVGGTLVGSDIAAVVDVPLSQAGVAAGADDHGGCFQHGQSADLLGVAADGANLFAFVVVPDFQGIVSTGGDQRFAIGTPGDIEHVMGVAFEAAKLRSRCNQ